MIPAASGMKVHLALGIIDMRKGMDGLLPREDQLLDLQGDACPCCGGTLHLIGESVSEILDHVPARLRVLRIRRPK